MPDTDTLTSETIKTLAKTLDDGFFIVATACIFKPNKGRQSFIYLQEDCFKSMQALVEKIWEGQIEDVVAVYRCNTPTSEFLNCSAVVAKEISERSFEEQKAIPDNLEWFLHTHNFPYWEPEQSAADYALDLAVREALEQRAGAA